MAALDALMGFHKPVKMGTQRGFHGSVTIKTETNHNANRIYFSTLLKSDFEIENLKKASFKFTEDEDGEKEVFIVFNVKNKGVPFYPISGRAITNIDLISQISKFVAEKYSVGNGFQFHIEKHTTLGKMDIYKMLPYRTIEEAKKTEN